MMIGNSFKFGVLILSWFVATGYGHDHKRLLISLYYESLCPGCIAFDTQQLYPVYSKIPQYIQLDLIPYGNARTTVYPNGTVEITCQHGELECKGNKLHACAISKLAPRLSADFVSCSMRQSSPPEALMFCADHLNLTKIQTDKIKVCAEGVEGLKLLYKNGLRTDALKPSHKWVPWVIFDDVYSKQDMQDSMTDLWGVVCKRLKDPQPPACNQVDRTDKNSEEFIQVCLKN